MNRSFVVPASMSAGVHVLLVAALSVTDHAEAMVREAPPRAQLIEVREAPEPEPEPEPPAPEPPAEVPVEPRRPRRREPAPARPSETPPPEPSNAPPPPIAFDQVVSAPGGSFAVPIGEGVERSGPVRRRREVRSSEPVAEGAGSEERAVPASDLSSPPQQPDDVRRSLDAHYPAQARAQGLEGRAMVRVRIERNGRARVVGVANASTPAFAQACRRAVQTAGRWTPARDRSGRPVPTVVRFLCEFEVSS